MGENLKYLSFFPIALFSPLSLPFTLLSTYRSSTFMSLHTHIYIHILTWHICMHILTHIYMLTYILSYIHTYTLHTYIHTHTHIIHVPIMRQIYLSSFIWLNLLNIISMVLSCGLWPLWSPLTDALLELEELWRQQLSPFGSSQEWRVKVKRGTICSCNCRTARLNIAELLSDPLILLFPGTGWRRTRRPSWVNHLKLVGSELAPWIVRDFKPLLRKGQRRRKRMFCWKKTKQNI